MTNYKKTGYVICALAFGSGIVVAIVAGAFKWFLT